MPPDGRGEGLVDIGARFAQRGEPARLLGVFDHERGIDVKVVYD
jgi:hypothetical protein